MPKFIKRDAVIEATQWFKNGDHPEVVPFIHDIIYGNSVCDKCKKSPKEHGIIHIIHLNEIICPGNYIVNDKGRVYVCREDRLNLDYEPFTAQVLDKYK